MSIASEIARLQTAKADLKTAIEAKGVTVSASDTLDDYPALVASIPSGGVTPTGTKQISITQNGTTTEDVTNYASAEIAVNVPKGAGVLKVQSGSFTPASNARSINIPLDSSITTIIMTYGVLPASKWSTYEGDAAYDKRVAGWDNDNSAAYFANNAARVGHIQCFLSANTNHHSYRTNQSATSISDGNMKVDSGDNAYLFIGGETYDYVIVGV